MCVNIFFCSFCSHQIHNQNYDWMSDSSIRKYSGLSRQEPEHTKLNERYTDTLTILMTSMAFISMEIVIVARVCICINVYACMYVYVSINLLRQWFDMCKCICYISVFGEQQNRIQCMTFFFFSTIVCAHEHRQSRT